MRKKRQTATTRRFRFQLTVDLDDKNEFAQVSLDPPRDVSPPAAVCAVEYLLNYLLRRTKDYEKSGALLVEGSKRWTVST